MVFLVVIVTDLLNFSIDKNRILFYSVSMNINPSFAPRNGFRAPHQKVKSPCVSVIYKNTNKPLWSRQEAIAACRERREIQDIVENAKLKVRPVIKKTANVRKVKGGYRIIGFGVLEMTKEEMKQHLRNHGYCRMRMGGMVFAV